MPKPITVEMLEAMSADQRKTLYKNAVALQTPAAKEVVALLDAGDLMARPPTKAAPTKAAPVKRAAKKTAPTKHGRQG